MATNGDHFGNLTPETYELIDDGVVRVSLRNKGSSELVTYNMTFAMMIRSVNLACALLNSNTAKVLQLAAAG